MGTLIILRHKKPDEYAVFDYRPGTFTNNFYYGVRDKNTVHNHDSNDDFNKYSQISTRITIGEWINRYGVPKCLERIYDPHGWVPF